MNKGKEFEKIFKEQISKFMFIQRIPDIMDFRSINNKEMGVFNE